MIEARPTITIETTAEGLQPGESVTVEFDHDPAAVALVLIPAPRTGRFASFMMGWRERRASRPT
jgi:hypothetical protein